MKICPKCKRKYNDSDMFCDVCGVNLEYEQPGDSVHVTSVTQNRDSAEKKNGLLWWQILIIVSTCVILLLAIVVSAVFIADKLNDDNGTEQVEEEEDKDDETADEEINTALADDPVVLPELSTTVEVTTTVQNPVEQNTIPVYPPVNDGDGALSGLSSKEEVLQYYKNAHSKVLTDAVSVIRTYSNNTQYNNYLEVRGNSALAGVANTLIGMFMKESTDALVYSGDAIRTYFPPAKNSVSGLAPDMISDYSIVDNGDSYAISLTFNSSESVPDDGTNVSHFVNIVQENDVETAAAGFVAYSGFRSEYIAPVITATIDKSSGQMTTLHTVVPSYLKFDSATIMNIITVDDVGIGLQCEQKWIIRY